ncbi:bifunctional adenosylcobinamide kinase/adenosylcobinamide-phosphate guanylyltransferase [Acaryochloris sp. IP29b_bin.148]|uniref:bifunctional adenosylcobinamide kinase/adenosylcobinamide-phosphate guanylyltransferase n=1 Tax=Acaryochloris sp. IP29b_bin.148 TaxID=2969218 RepID=UPI00262AAC44|nr:bifunctional adenosylcobinamide kinase/adenosylcobinamide-phosphate guanylyltransferase [Acaryochloris sp. IP29b_bin.148]
MVDDWRLILVTGPARSGKSEWAENLASQSNLSVIYVATAIDYPEDAAWQARIQAHQQRRPPDWQTLHAPIDLAGTIQRQPGSVCLLIDSLGTWLTNVLEQDAVLWSETLQKLLAALTQAECQIIVVGEETGWGVVPAYPVGRLFRDRMGELLRQIGAISDQVYLVSAGYALNIKALGIYVSPMSPSYSPEAE